MNRFRYILQLAGARCCVIGLLVLFGGIGLLPATSIAYEKTKIDVANLNDFVVEPGKTEIFVDPGQTVVRNITITSRINHPIDFEISTEDIEGANDHDRAVVLLGNERGPYSLSDYIKPEITEFRLEFGEKITIPVTVSIPDNAEPGGFYGAIIISTKAESGTTSGAGAKLVSRVGSLFLVRVNGEVKQEGALTGFKLIGPKKIFYASKPEGFEISFSNTGRVHLVPYGEVVVRNMLGIVTDRMPVDAYFVLPDSTRYREVKWTGERLTLGWYTATVSLYKGYGEDFDEIKIGFFVFPWRVIIVAFIVISFIVYVIGYLRKNFVFKKKR